MNALPAFFRRSGFGGVFLSLLLALSLHARGAGEITRSFTLQPGWNAIHLDVEPPDAAPAKVFAGLPVEMVWCFFPTESSVQFISDPGTQLFNVPGWTVYFPAANEKAALTNLYAIQSGRSYLVKTTSANPVTLTITGQAVLRQPRWQPDGYTLTGLPVDPATGVTVRDYFSGSTAHHNQPAYRLDPAGTWTRVSGNEQVRPGAAYWIYTKGSTDFLAPLVADLEGRAGLDFGGLANRLRFVLRNATSFAINAQIQNTSDLPLITPSRDATGNQTWTPLGTLAVSVPAGGQTLVDLGLQRDGFTAASEGLLKITGGGYALNVPVSAETASTSTPVGGLREGAMGAAPLPNSNPDAGLWIGSVTLAKVSHHLAADPVATLPTPATFDFRVILHVDDAGKVRLLKEVWLLRKESGTEFALVTDPARLAEYRGAITREDQPFGYRFSGVAFDFTGIDKLLSGAFGGTLSGQIEVGRDLPTNPFKHKYHPQHDDRDGQFRPLPANLEGDKEEVFQVSRSITLNFNAPGAAAVPGQAARSGTYRESFVGLHRIPLFASGTFTLQRVNQLALLNPAP